MNEPDAKSETEVARLWARGEDDDDRAIEALLARSPASPRPAFLRGPGATTLHPWVERARVEEALPLLREQYWNLGRFDDRAIARAHAHSSAWVVARDGAGAMVATARAVSDRVKYAYVGDVAVHAAWRGRGLGAALMSMLLAHPCLRDVARIELGTRDAMTFYERLGFTRASSVSSGPYTRWTMALVRK
jgi:ribosomal protein S18 acetylase RimI-like enzyme